MKKLSFLILFSISTPLFSQTIPFELTSDGHLLIKASIEGHEGNFIFDTGGGINVFFTDFAKNLISKNSYNFFTAFRATGEKIHAPLFYNERIDFAGKSFKNTPYSIFDITAPGLSGILSLQMFQEVDILIDYEHKTLTLTQIDTLKNNKHVDIQLSTYADNALDIFTYVMLNHTYKIKVLLDSGAGENSFWLSDTFMTLLEVDPSKVSITEKSSEFNEQRKTKVYKANIASISNAFAKVNDPTIQFVEGLIYEGKTSINWLGQKIGISLKNKKIYILDESKKLD